MNSTAKCRAISRWFMAGIDPTSGARHEALIEPHIVAVIARHQERSGLARLLHDRVATLAVPHIVEAICCDGELDEPWSAAMRHS